MKIICSQESLFYGLQTVQKAISAKTRMPIYNGILFEASEDKVHLFATDLEIGIDCYIPAKVEEEGSVVMPYKIIINLVNKLPKEDILIESSEDSSIIKVKEFKYKILGFKGEEFSSFPQIEPVISAKMSQGKLKEAIERTIFAIGKAERRTFLNGALFKMTKDQLEITTTDSHRLTYNKCAIMRIGQSSQDEYGVIIPQRTLTELLKLLDDSDETFVNINMEEKQMMFVLYPEESQKSIRVYSRLIEGNFPDFQQIIPKSFNTQIKINRENLKEGIGRVSLFTELEIGNIDISVKAIKEAIKVENECELTLTSETQDLGKAREQVICYNEGNDIKMTVNCKYFLDVFGVIDTENIIIKIVDERSPIIIIPENDKDYLYIVMPILRENN